MERRLYTREEEGRLRSALASGGDVRCPRCAVRMERREVPPREGVAYRRDRIWLACGGCGRSLVVDRRRVGGEGR